MKRIHSVMLPGKLIEGLGEGREAPIIIPHNAKMEPGDYLVLLARDRKVDDLGWMGTISMVLDVTASSECPGLEDGFMLLRVGVIG